MNKIISISRNGYPMSAKLVGMTQKIAIGTVDMLGLVQSACTTLKLPTEFFDWAISERRNRSPVFELIKNRSLVILTNLSRLISANESEQINPEKPHQLAKTGLILLELESRLWDVPDQDKTEIHRDRIHIIIELLNSSVINDGHVESTSAGITKTTEFTRFITQMREASRDADFDRLRTLESQIVSEIISSLHR